MDTDQLIDWWQRGGLAVPPGAHVEVDGSDPVLECRHRAGEAAAAAMGLAGVWSAHMGELRGGAPQTVRVDVTDAATALLGFLYQKAEDLDLTRAQSPLTALYATSDDRWIHLHGGFPHLAKGTVDLLGCDSTAESVAASVAQWPAVELETAIADAGLCAAVARTRGEWGEHPQGRALAELPTVAIRRIADAPPRRRPESTRPLDGVRVADLTRVLAGPTCGRTLAAHGADVLRIGSPSLPSVEPFVVETGHGKRNAFVDLDTTEGQRCLAGLLSTADIFCQSYRPGSLDRRGLDPEALAQTSPGIIYVSISCYGNVGPWSERGGWEQLAQTATGIAAAEGRDAPPRLIPAAVTDYTTGYLAAAGAMAALARQMTEGGSWLVEVSLCQTARWVQSGGDRCDPETATGLGDVESRLASTDSPWGTLAYLEPPEQMEHTPAHWERPPQALGSASPVWRTTSHG